MSSLIRDFVRREDLPIFDNVEFAKGCEAFIFRAKNERDCWKLYHDFIRTVPKSKEVKAYNIGLRPDYPIPVARYFIEISVSDRSPISLIPLFWTTIESGRLDI